MRRKSLWFGAVFWLLPLTQWAQDSTVLGKVLAAEDLSPLIGANVRWLDSQIGTVTDADGWFQLDRQIGANQLVVTYIGFEADTVDVQGETGLQIMLQAGQTLEDVEVVHRQKSTSYSFLDPAKVERINEKELLKAACCNLSESFETNPSVDVAFTDAVTGTRQIQMLGLSGPNIQITRENIPFVRGLASVYGLTFIPGTWVEGMQLSKGTGSVVNGFESIAGQINVEMRKPEKGDRLYANLYVNEMARLEGNLNLRQEINNTWSTALLLHGKSNPVANDRNQDQFLDNPLSDQFIAINRWKYLGKNGLRAQLGVEGMSIDNRGGQLTDLDLPPGKERWGMDLNLDRIGGWLKLGSVNDFLPWRSWAIQAAWSHHRQDSRFGHRVYDALQRSVYLNLLYQSIIGNTNHQMLMGTSWQHDQYEETFNDVEYDRVEQVPGAFFEYTYGGHEKLSLVAGLRGDHHNAYGFFITPRLHMRYGFSDQLVGRISLGRGQRTANILAEQNGIMASARRFYIEGDGSDKPYGLNPEIAWNTGANLVYTFQVNQQSGSFSLDFYHTVFQNQIVVDLDVSPQEVYFYNLEGRSYSNSFQAQLDYEIFPRMDARIAYRWYDVKTTYRQGLLDKPLISRNRLFLNLAYATKSGWDFDYTINWQGRKRLPDTNSNPETVKLNDFSPDFVVMNAQVTKKWNAFEIYLGVENLLNFRQDQPILASEDPFGAYFDSSLTWGPIFGRNTYLGMRYRLQD